MRVFAFIIILVVGAAALWFANPQPKAEVAVQRIDQWAGDQETGCMYPVSDISKGQNPIWWSTRYRQWNIFESRALAQQAGYYECP